MRNDVVLLVALVPVVDEGGRPRLGAVVLGRGQVGRLPPFSLEQHLRLAAGATSVRGRTAVQLRLPCRRQLRWRVWARAAEKPTEHPGRTGSGTASGRAGGEGYQSTRRPCLVPRPWVAGQPRRLVPARQAAQRRHERLTYCRRQRRAHSIAVPGAAGRIHRQVRLGDLDPDDLAAVRRARDDLVAPGDRSHYVRVVLARHEAWKAQPPATRRGNAEPSVVRGAGREAGIWDRREGNPVRRRPGGGCNRSPPEPSASRAAPRGPLAHPAGARYRRRRRSTRGGSRRRILR